MCQAPGEVALPAQNLGRPCQGAGWRASAPMLMPASCSGLGHTRALPGGAWVNPVNVRCEDSLLLEKQPPSSPNESLLLGG